MTSSTALARKTRRATLPPRATPASVLPASSEVSANANATRLPSKLDQVQDLLLAPAGATIAELMAATGWQQHSVRGAIAGALKKRGLIVASDKVDGVRRYRASLPA